MWLLGLVALLALAGSQKSEPPPPPPREKDFQLRISRRAAEVIPGGRKAQAVLDMAKDARGGKRGAGSPGPGPNNPRQVGRR
jgi:hypothetical protein